MSIDIEAFAEALIMDTNTLNYIPGAEDNDLNYHRKPEENE